MDIGFVWGKTGKNEAPLYLLHAFMLQDIETSIGVFDVSDTDYAFMKESVSNTQSDDYDCLVQLCDSFASRYGTSTAMVERWKKVSEIKSMFEAKIGCSIYDLLLGVVENSFRFRINGS
ncbi:hypothetical protein IM774_12260 [Erysipelotrichaceae bacterium RD49]|nr:hypothetical protein [Erysipelotrichaceae bacterium RD49]